MIFRQMIRMQQQLQPYNSLANISFTYLSQAIRILKMQEIRYDRYNAFTTKSGNIVWGAAMQLAWNELSSKFAKNAPLRLNTQDPARIKAINNFNERPLTQNDINANSVYVKSGYGQQTVDLINKEVIKKFPEKTFPPLNFKLGKLDIISYAYLLKKIVFPTVFERRKHKTFKFKNTAVDSFYADKEQQKKQVYVHHYLNQKNFVVHIEDKDRSDLMFLIKNEKHLTVDEAIKISIESSDSQGDPLKKSDSFEMPVIHLDEQRSYEEFVGLPFLNPELCEYYIRVMKERIKLDITESGAKVENEAVMVLSRSMAMVPKQIKEIILNSDFWIIMKEPKKHPYLCAFIQSIGK